MLLALANVSAIFAADLDKFDDPSAKSTGTADADRIVLEAGDADAKATLRVAAPFLVTDTRAPQVVLTVTAPFDSKKADRVDVGTNSGLTAGSNATLDFTLFRMPLALDAANDLRAQCKRLIPLLIPGYQWTEDIQSLLICNEEILDKKKLEAVVDAINEQRKECEKCRNPTDAEQGSCVIAREAINKNCADPLSTDPLCVILRKGHKEVCASCDAHEKKCKGFPTQAALAPDVDLVIAQNRREIERLNRTQNPALHGFTLSLKANRQEFAYVLSEAPTADPTTTDKKGFGTAVAYTYVGERSATTFGYSHEESYKAADKSQVCSPIGETGSLNCKEATLGAPTRKKGEFGFIETRALFWRGRYGLAPRVEYDFKESTFAVRLPFYFVPGKDGIGLTGGFALGFAEGADDKKDEFGVTVFVSKAFKFFD